MECRRFHNLLNRWSDGEPLSEGERAALAGHRRACAACRALFRGHLIVRYAFDDVAEGSRHPVEKHETGQKHEGDRVLAELAALGLGEVSETLAAESVAPAYHASSDDGGQCSGEQSGNGRVVEAGPVQCSWRHLDQRQEAAVAGGDKEPDRPSEPSVDMLEWAQWKASAGHPFVVVAADDPEQEVIEMGSSGRFSWGWLPLAAAAALCFAFSFWLTQPPAEQPGGTGTGVDQQLVGTSSTGADKDLNVRRHRGHWQLARSAIQVPVTVSATAKLPEDPIEPVRAVIRAVGEELDKPIRPLSDATAGAIRRFVNLLPEMPPQVPELEQMLPEFFRPKRTRGDLEQRESGTGGDRKKAGSVRRPSRYISCLVSDECRVGTTSLPSFYVHMGHLCSLASPSRQSC